MSKQFIKNLLNLFMSIALFVGMSIPLIVSNVGACTGFTCLLFDENWMGAFTIFCGFLMWVGVGCTITSIILSIICLIGKKYKSLFTLLVLILCGFAAVSYLTTGIVSSVITSESTKAYWYFILFVVFGTPIIILSLLAEDPEYSINQTSKQTASSPTIFNDPNAVYVMDGEVKTLFVYKEYIKITAKKNMRSLMTHNIFSGEKKVYYDNILGIQFRPSTAMVLGYIQVELANDFSKNNFNSEGSVTFSHNKISNEQAQEIANYIDQKIRESKQLKTMIIDNNFSKADELLKYKALLDQGVLTQEEFDQKKKDLLG